VLYASWRMPSVLSLRRGESLHEDPLARVRELVLPFAASEGHNPVIFPNLCIYRFARATTIAKAATFGVTLGMVLQGQARIRLGAHTLSLEPTRLLVFTRETEHHLSTVNAGHERPYIGMSLGFGPERVARALIELAEAGGSSASEPVPAFLLPCDEAIANALERLLAAVIHPVERKLIAPLVVDEILFRLLQSDAAAAVRSGVGQPNDAKRILETMGYIRLHHAEKLNVERLAKRAGMSASHFAHRFRAVARMSPMRYVREARLERARTLLLENGSRVGEVALDVGFESPAHFTREYKRRFGTSPSRSLAALDLASPDRPSRRP